MFSEGSGLERPMPLPPPVTSATRPASECDDAESLLWWACGELTGEVPLRGVVVIC